MFRSIGKRQTGAGDKESTDFPAPKAVLGLRRGGIWVALSAWFNALRALGGGMQSASDSRGGAPTGALAEPIDALFANLEADAASAAVAREHRDGELAGRWLQR